MVDDKHQVIVHAEAMGNGQDTDNLVPMLDGAKENLKQIGKGEKPLDGIRFTADSNYHTNLNILKCQDENIDAYIPDINFRKRDQRFKDRERFKDGVNRPPKPGQNKSIHTELKDFIYDDKTDSYTCPQGNTLRLRVKRHRMKNGIYKTYRIKDDSCVNCPLRAECMANKKARQRYICVPLEMNDKELTPSPKCSVR